MAEKVMVTLARLKEAAAKIGLDDACAPGLASFAERMKQPDVKGQDGYEWTPKEALRVYAKNPRFLRWLERNGVVPMLEVEGLPSVEKRTHANKTPRERRGPLKRDRVAPQPFRMPRIGRAK